MRTLIKTITLTTALAVNFAMASSGNGNGGGAFVCSANGKILKARQQDLWQSEKKYGSVVNIADERQGSYEVIEKLQGVNPEFHQAVREALDYILANRRIDDIYFEKTDLSFTFGPDDCAEGEPSITNAAVYYDKENFVTYRKRIWDFFSETDKAALNVHEAVYRALRILYRGETQTAQKITMLLMSNRPISEIAEIVNSNSDVLRNKALGLEDVSRKINEKYDHGKTFDLNQKYFFPNHASNVNAVSEKTMACTYVHSLAPNRDISNNPLDYLPTVHIKLTAKNYFEKEHMWSEKKYLPVVEFEADSITYPKFKYPSKDIEVIFSHFFQQFKVENNNDKHKETSDSDLMDLRLDGSKSFRELPRAIESLNWQILSADERTIDSDTGRGEFSVSMVEGEQKELNIRLYYYVRTPKKFIPYFAGMLICNNTMSDIKSRKEKPVEWRPRILNKVMRFVNGMDF